MSGLPLSIDPAIETALLGGAAVAVGVSGGKDSQAAAIAVTDYLDAIGHKGPRVCVHADLGEIEWKDSLPECEALAAHLGWELMVVRRPSGGLLPRWQKRWRDNVTRYANLECIKVISPWSSPSLRFCTSELKTDVIASALRKRFPGLTVVSVAGIRAEESRARARMPVSAPHAKLTRRDAPGWSWHPIITATKEQVLRAIDARGMKLHPAYTVHGMSRVSCAFCIMSSNADLTAAAVVDETNEVFREIAGLELRSTFSFQAGRWLTPYRGDLLGADWAQRMESALSAAAVREEAERRIPADALYQKGWPLRVPDLDQSTVIADVRREVSQALGLDVLYTTAGDVRDRIADLYAIQQSKGR